MDTTTMQFYFSTIVIGLSLLSAHTHRPLHGATVIPFGTPYPWGLDEKGEESTGTCVVDMVFECATRRIRRTTPNGRMHVYERLFPNWRECEQACQRVRKCLYPDAQDYPFGGNSTDDYSGYTAEVVIELAEENRWTIYILHGANKIYSWRPTDDEREETQT